MLYWTPESSFVYNNLEEVIIPFDGNKLTFSTFANGEVKGKKVKRHSCFFKVEGFFKGKKRGCGRLQKRKTGQSVCKNICPVKL